MIIQVSIVWLTANADANCLTYGEFDGTNVPDCEECDDEFFIDSGACTAGEYISHIHWMQPAILLVMHVILSLQAE